MSAAHVSYRVVLAVTEDTLGAAGRTAESLCARCAPGVELLLAGPAPALQRLMEIQAAAGRFSTLPVEASGAEEIFGFVLQTKQDRDLLFVQPGVVLPPLGDLRLAWTSRLRSGVATVSPVCEGSACTSLRLGEWEGGVPAERLEDVDAIDRICCDASRCGVEEIPAFAKACVYVAAEAMHAAMGIEAGRGGRGWFEFFLAATASLRYAHLLAGHVFVGAPLDRSPYHDGGPVGPPVLQSLRRTVRQNLLCAAEIPARSARSRAAPRLLHITHGWGGGIEKWVREFAVADLRARNLVLRPEGWAGKCGVALKLYPDAAAERPSAVWPLRPAIAATALSHEGYRAALSSMVHRYGVEAIVVSSLIGHSLDALRTGLPTVVVCHDYYPFCPALNITFGEVCASCHPDRLAECTLHNPLNRHFRWGPPSLWLELRQAFAEAVAAGRVTLLAPSPSVTAHYARLMPELAARMRVEPHGARRAAPPAPPPSFDATRPLRILVPGSLSPQKGKDLLQAMTAELARFAEVHLVGCGEHGDAFQGLPGFHVTPHYDWPDLPDIVERIAPDLALLLSVAPETFSYTLREMFDLQVPVVATRLGSFVDHIQDGRDGFLVEPKVDEILALLQRLAAQREPLLTIHENLAAKPRRSLSEMAQRYHEILGTPEFSARAYFAEAWRRQDHTELPAYCQLFWRLPGQSFQERESCRVACTLTEERQTVALRIPPLAAPPEQLRLDPVDRPCYLVLFALRIFDAAGGRVWSWDGKPAAFQRERVNQLAFAGRDGAASAPLLAVTGNDPFFTLPLSDGELSQLQRGATLEMEAAIRTPAQAAEALAAARAAEPDWVAELEERDRLIRKLSHALAEAQAQARQRGGGELS